MPPVYDSDDDMPLKLRVKKTMSQSRAGKGQSGSHPAVCKKGPQHRLVRALGPICIGAPLRAKQRKFRNDNRFWNKLCVWVDPLGAVAFAPYKMLRREWIDPCRSRVTYAPPHSAGAYTLLNGPRVVRENVFTDNGWRICMGKEQPVYFSAAIATEWSTNNYCD